MDMCIRYLLYENVVLRELYSYDAMCRTCAAARRSSTLKEKSEYLFLENKGGETRKFLSLQVKIWIGSRHLVFWLLGTLTGLKRSGTETG